MIEQLYLTPSGTLTSITIQGQSGFWSNDNVGVLLSLKVPGLMQFRIIPRTFVGIVRGSYSSAEMQSEYLTAQDDLVCPLAFWLVGHATAIDQQV